MHRLARVFLAIFIAGAASLILELSLLREFTYVMGSTAFSNSLIISVFLSGLAVGTYVGAWKRLQSGDQAAARLKFALSQASILLFAFVFYATKDYFVYVCASQSLVVFYFIMSAFIPSFLAGAAYAVSVELLFHSGQKYVTYIYACSTSGSVIGGLLHGFVFMNYFGPQSAYVCAIFCSAVALTLVYPFRRRNTLKIFFFCVAGLLLAVQTEAANRAFYPFLSQQLLFRRSSAAGQVEVWRLQDGRSFEMLVNNAHQYFSYDWDTQVHREWAQTSLQITDRPSEALLLGYGSGVSAAALLASDRTVRVDTVENSLAVIDAGARFFPDEYALLMSDPRSRILVRDFRNYIRFTDRRYDIILLDVGLRDPYAVGFYTKEFLSQLKRVLKPGGVVLMLGIGLSWTTTQQGFPYIYKNIDSDVSEPFRRMVFFLRLEPLDQKLKAAYARIGAVDKEPVVYTDRRVYGITWKAAKDRIGKYAKELGTRR